MRELRAMETVLATDFTDRSSASSIKLTVHRPLMSGAGLMIAAFLVDIAIIGLCATLSGVVYHFYVYGDGGLVENYIATGFLVCAFYVTPRLLRRRYAVAEYFTRDRPYAEIFITWNYAFLCAAALAFLTKTGGVFSRGAIVIFYLSGLLAIMTAQLMISSGIRAACRLGIVAARRILLVGTPEYLKRFEERYGGALSGLQVVGAIPIDDLGQMKAIDDDVRSAVAFARQSHPDDVFILAPWSDNMLVDKCVHAFLQLPVSIHLGPDRIMQRFTDIRLFKFGRVASLNLIRPPLTALEIFIKRIFDVIGAMIALILLLPVFLCVALWIKLDSPGPAFFFQTRYGFNQQPFKIIKFRSMTTMDDGACVKQASVNDPRITRVGRFIRRTNIDELPQLLNVLVGHMSLVGPRPHALAHDREYEEKIALYARRHNVKPGITGWAQVNGLRGETETDDKMRDRVRYDLQYIDNWSMSFDLAILFLTVFSKRAFTNAR